MRHQILQKIGLRTKFMLVVLVLILSISGAFISEIRKALLENMRQQLDERGVYLGSTVAAQSVDLIFTNNLYAIHQLIKITMEGNPDIRYLFITDTSGELLGNSFGQGLPEGLLEANFIQEGSNNFQVVRLYTNEGLIHDVAVPVWEGKAGTVRLGLTETSIWANLRHLTWKMVVVAVLVAVLGSGAAFALACFLTAPISRLVAAVEGVARGDLSRRVKLGWASKEAHLLAETFNFMMDNLERSTREIRRQNDELKNLWKELRAKEEMRTYLLQKVISAQEEERKRIARELHDQVGQSVTYLMISLQGLKQTAPEAEGKLEELRQLTVEVLQLLRDLAFELRPSLLDNLGLKEAVERYCQDYARRYKIKVDIQAEGEWKTLPPETAIALYRVIQEALTNVVRHARASQVSLVLERREGEVLAIIEDDGCGFVPEQVLAGEQGGKHLGLFGMQERVALVGGTLTIESSLGQGTTVYIRVPVPSQ